VAASGLKIPQAMEGVKGPAYAGKEGSMARWVKVQGKRTAINAVR